MPKSPALGLKMHSGPVPMTAGMRASQIAVSPARSPEVRNLPSTFLGGSGYDQINSIAVDGLGNAFVVGFTRSAEFPTQGAFQGSIGSEGMSDAFVAQLNEFGSGLVYSSYLGGSGTDTAFAVTIDIPGNLYVAGSTASTNFPTMAPYQGTLGGETDAFVAKVDSFGSLVFSTYLGGSFEDGALAIGVNSSRNVYVAGFTWSPNFPVQSEYQGTHRGGGDAFVTKFTVSGSALVYSSYLGGSASDVATGLTLDFDGNVYLVGSTSSADIPADLDLQTGLGNPAGAATDVYVARIGAEPDLLSLLFATYLGGSGSDWGNAIAVGLPGQVYITGETESANFPNTGTAYQATIASPGSSDAFVAKIDLNMRPRLYVPIVVKGYFGGW